MGGSPPELERSTIQEATAAARVCSPCSRKSRTRWVWTVRGETPRLCAISLSERPCAMSHRICACRGVTCILPTKLRSPRPDLAKLTIASAPEPASRLPAIRPVAPSYLPTWSSCPGTAAASRRFAGLPLVVCAAIASRTGEIFDAKCDLRLRCAPTTVSWFALRKLGPTSVPIRRLYEIPPPSGAW